MYGKKSNLEEELERLREKKARINAEQQQQAKAASVNPPIKNDPEFKKAQQRRNNRDDHDSDGRYSDDLDDSSFNRNRNRNLAKNVKNPNSSGDHASPQRPEKNVSPRRQEKRNSPRRHEKHQSRNISRHSSTDKDRSLSKSERREIEFGWKDTETLGSVPPNDYTITNITQNYDLLVKIHLNKFS